METVRGWTDRDLRRLDEIIVEGERRFKERQTGSGALVTEARAVLAGVATSGWRIARPQMIWVSHREGSEDDTGRFVDDFGAFARALRG
jgi:glutamate-1-semialdehyde 2,1-aminomutase